MHCRGARTSQIQTSFEVEVIDGHLAALNAAHHLREMGILSF